jgi:hypothetical protein
VTIMASGVVFSTTTVSTTRAAVGTSFRAGFFTGARLGFALATVRFLVAAFATLRDLPRLAELALRSFARFCAFDPFLRLAMITTPWSGLCASQANPRALLIK